jgi:hypothetical protein
MKKLAWLQVILGVLTVAAVAYVVYWSRTGLVDKLEGPAFAGQSDASRWTALHPAFVTFGRWLLWAVALFGIAVLGLGILQVRRYPKGNQSHPAAFQVLAGLLVALGAFLVLIAVKPDQFVLDTGQGGLQLGMVSPMWGAAYSVLTFLAILLGVAIAGVGFWQYTLASRAAEPVRAKPGWKSARTARRR